MGKSNFRRFVLASFAQVLVLLSSTGAASARDFATELADVRRIAGIIERGEPADLLITNVTIVDVYNEDTYPGSLLIDKGRIVAVNPDPKVKARTTFDGQGLFAIPGLIDGHFHIDSQLVVPTALSEAMVPQGTTSVIAEMCDLVGAAGQDGLRVATVFLTDHDALPYRIYPFAPGKKVDVAIVEKILDWPFIIGLGELNNTAFLGGSAQDFAKIAYAKSLNKMLDGHVEAPTPYAENLFPAVGIIDDHDNWSPTGIVPNNRLGLATLIATGLGLLPDDIAYIVKNHIPTDNVLLATDNLDVAAMVKRGHINAAVEQSIALGIAPIKAIKMGTYNIARHFRMEDQIGSLTPGRYADIVLIKDLRHIRPEYVFKGGELVAQQGKLVRNASIDYSALISTPHPGLADIKPHDMADAIIATSADGTRVKTRVFNSHGFGEANFFTEQWLKTSNGRIVPELNGEKLLMFSIIQRYPPANARRTIVNGYIGQFAMDKGAVAIAYSSPQPYIMVLGTNVADMVAAVTEADKYPGAIAVASAQKIDAVLPMDIQGMMTTYSTPELIQKSDALSKSLAALGHTNNERLFDSLFALFWAPDRHLMLK